MLLSITVSPINKYTSNNSFHKKFIFFSTKENKIFLFLVEHYTIKMDINVILQYHP